MDLTIPVSDFTLNIRVAVILKTQKGFVLERSSEGYYFLVGGRIKIGESSLDAARREILEELGYGADSFVFKGILEQFFGTEERKVHELCFVYSSTLPDSFEIPAIFHELSLEEIEKINFVPVVLKNILNAPDTDPIKHLILDQVHSI